MGGSSLNAEPLSREASMTEQNDSPKIPEELRALFGDPPFLDGEDPNLYQSLLGALINDRKPETITDWIAIHDEINALWEEKRLRRASTGIIRTGVLPALRKFASEIFWHDHPFVLDKIPQAKALEYFSEDLEERKEFKALLAQYGVTEGEVHARAAQLNSDALLMFEGMISARERKRRRLRKQQRQIARERRNNQESSAED